MSHILTLQLWLKTNNYAAFLLPRADEHMGEYILASSERLHWLTGFTGSAGYAVILQNEAALFVDGRYTTQAPMEVNTAQITALPLTLSPKDWLKRALKGQGTIAYDPDLHTMKEVKALMEAGLTLIAVTNPIDAMWQDRPSYPLSKLFMQPLKFAGLSHTEKLAALRKEMNAEHYVLNQLDAIAWVFNIRADDTPNTPLPHCFAIISMDKTTLFIDPRKVDFTLEGVDMQPLTAFKEALKALGNQTVLLNPDTCPQSIANQLSNVVEGKDLVDLPRAMKNAAELQGMRDAHVRDGVALAHFLNWFYENATDETSVMNALENARAMHPFYRGASFNTIAGAGANAAIVHYRSSDKTNIKIPKDSLFLLDSGGQYIDGTTDVTRTFAVGEASIEQKQHYTLVLKGHLALSRAIFPKNTSGTALDALARQFLWEAGLNFDHGTGHGVGVYLGVHEGSFRISPLAHSPLKPGMVLSNEPGFYQAGSHGIRIENLIVVKEEANGFYGFETLTLCPYEKQAIDKSLLTRQEITQVNAYHKRVYNEISPFLKGKERDVFKKLCSKI